MPSRGEFVNRAHSVSNSGRLLLRSRSTKLSATDNRIGVHQFSSRMTLTSPAAQVGLASRPDGARTIIVARLAVEYWFCAITVMRTGVNRRPR
jgi:hypothetical protein